MNCLNDRSNPIFIKGKERTQNIDIQLKKTRIYSLNTECVIGGSKADILLFLKGGPAKNLVCTFFKYTTNKCDYCGIEKNKSIQLDRAHCNRDNCDRTSLLKKSIDIHFVNKETPIKIKNILIRFIQLHKDIPLFILCKKCN